MVLPLFLSRTALTAVFAQAMEVLHPDMASAMAPLTTLVDEGVAGFDGSGEGLATAAAAWVVCRVRSCVFDFAGADTVGEAGEISISSDRPMATTGGEDGKGEDIVANQVRLQPLGDPTRRKRREIRWVESFYYVIK